MKEEGGRDEGARSPATRRTTVPAREERERGRSSGSAAHGVTTSRCRHPIGGKVWVGASTTMGHHRMVMTTKQTEADTALCPPARHTHYVFEDDDDDEGEDL